MLRRDTIRLLAAMLLAGSMSFYVQYILIPYQEIESKTTDRPRGNLSDLYPRWLGARELLFRHRDPYSPEVTREIQAGYYGRPLDPSRQGDPKDQQAFAYPLFVVFLLAPIVSQPFEVVRPIFTWFLAFLTAASVLLWAYAIRLRTSIISQVTIAILTLGTFQVAQGLKLQQLSLLVGALIAAAAALIAAGHFLTAGAFLALALIKPQLALPMIAWLCLWSTGDLKHRWRLVGGFAIATALLLAGSHAILPNWLYKFQQAVIAYRGYTGGAQTLLTMLLGTVPGRLLNGLMIAISVLVGWRARRFPESSREFSRVTALILAVTVVIVPMVALYNQILLLPALLILLQIRDGGPIRRFVRPMLRLTFCWVALPWAATILLWIAVAASWKVTTSRICLLPLFSTPALPLFVAGLLAWVALFQSKTADQLNVGSD